MMPKTSEAAATATSSSSSSSLRIASLLPSTTDICIALGLEHNVVGITHECDFPPSSHPLFDAATASAPLVVSKNGANRTSIAPLESPLVSPPLTLTVSQIDPHTQSQGDIDAAVKSSLHGDISLYHLNGTSLVDARPTVILTQSLCDVCAVATSDVTEEVACRFSPRDRDCRVLSLEPQSLHEVADTFVTVAEACGVEDRGVELKRRFWEGVQSLTEATDTKKNGDNNVRKPRVLFLEWLDPPFDAGHWIPDMLEQSGCASALPSHRKRTCKSVQLTWEQVYASDPDVVMIGCCGFDLQRNQSDARAAKEKLEPLRAFRENNIFASDGNLYFARPGPGLREGMALLARCAYHDNKEVVAALETIEFMPEEGQGWSKVTFPKEADSSSSVPDMEDLVNEKNYTTLHEEACRAKRDVYRDPATGYNVFTEYAHAKRGKCCGSGCRHCAYNHVNVKDKAMRIQQPAFLYEGSDSDNGGSSNEDPLFAPLSAIPPQSRVKVLFFSGGKDSFLAIRKLVKDRKASPLTPFHLILLTTFDAKSRIIAHQEIPINTVLRQAEHLQIPLLGIPLHRGSGETYLQRIDKGMEAIRRRVPRMRQPSLVFGDLHLNHIGEWRHKELALSPNCRPLEYPLWKVPYEELMTDLEASCVPVVVSAVTKEGVRVGRHFTRTLWREAVEMGMNGFGEEGEFHSVAEVWKVSREQALGLECTSKSWLTLRAERLRQRGCVNEPSGRARD